jgi:hypothetical protein
VVRLINPKFDSMALIATYKALDVLVVLCDCKTAWQQEI